MRVVLPDVAIAAFEASQGNRELDTVERENEAFLVYPGMGPCRYITRDGRFLIGADEFFDEPKVREATDQEAIGTLRSAAKRFSLPLLIKLMPGRTSDARDCSECAGTGRFGATSGIICVKCSGLGWEGKG